MTDTVAAGTLAEVQSFSFPLSGTELDRWNELHGEEPAKIPAVVSQEDLAALIAKLAVLEGRGVDPDPNSIPALPTVY